MSKVIVATVHVYAVVGSNMANKKGSKDAGTAFKFGASKGKVHFAVKPVKPNPIFTVKRRT